MAAAGAVIALVLVVLTLRYQHARRESGSSHPVLFPTPAASDANAAE